MYRGRSAHHDRPQDYLRERAFLSCDPAHARMGMRVGSPCEQPADVCPTYQANAGDSRSVLSVGGEAKPMSFDHKPTNAGENARIVAGGGFVEFGRVNGA